MLRDMEIRNDKIINKMEKKTLISKELENLHEKNLRDSERNMEVLNSLKESGKISTDTYAIHMSKLDNICNSGVKYCEKNSADEYNELNSVIFRSLSNTHKKFEFLPKYKIDNITHTNSADILVIAYDNSYDYTKSRNHNHLIEQRNKHITTSIYGKDYINTTQIKVPITEEFLAISTNNLDFAKHCFDKIFSDYVIVDPDFGRMVLFKTIDLCPSLNKREIHSRILPISTYTIENENNALNIHLNLYTDVRKITLLFLKFYILLFDKSKIKQLEKCAILLFLHINKLIDEIKADDINIIKYLEEEFINIDAFRVESLKYIHVHFEKSDINISIINMFEITDKFLKMVCEKIN